MCTIRQGIAPTNPNLQPANSTRRYSLHMSATTAPHPQQTSITRESLIALAREPKPWKALALFAAIAGQIESDWELRFHGIAALAKLGLRELAHAELATLPREVQHAQQFQQLALAINALPTAELPARHTLEANIGALLARNAITPDLATSLRGIADAHSLRWFAAVDGNVVCSQAHPGGSILPGLHMLTDERAAATHTITGLNEAPETCPAPLSIDGLATPWLLIDACRAYTRTALGYRRPIWVVEPNIRVLAAGLGMCDLREYIADDRIHWFLGTSAEANLTTFLSSRQDRQLPLRAIGKLQPGNFLKPVIERAAAAQSSACFTLRQSVEAKYAARDAAHWKGIFAHAALGNRTLRVLIPTCRYSTFIQHSSADIAEGLRSLGHDAQVLIEPDDQSILSANAYWHAFAEFEPDLVILINYPRCARPNIAPKNVPWVTWLQDAMPHLFTPESATGQTALDYSVGYLFSELFDRASGWPRERAMHAPVLASEKKFFVERLPKDSRYSCDIAFVSHHHETPEQMRDRLIQTMGGSGFAPIGQALYAETQRIVASSHRVEVRAELREMIRNVVPAFNATCTAAQCDQLLHMYCSPLAGQIFRHQALEWAADACTRRGWTMHLYGKGWEKHPTLGKWAKGPLAHGAELRQAYAAARVQLHLDVNTLTHQRIIECALSGGFVAARFVADALVPMRNLAEIAAADQPVDVEPRATMPLGAWKVDKHAPLRKYEELRRDLGLSPTYPSGVWPRTLERVTQREQDDLEQWQGMDPAWLWGGLDEQFFTSPMAMEKLIERAIGDEPWRSARAESMRQRCLEQMTYATTCRRMMGMLASATPQ